MRNLKYILIMIITFNMACDDLLENELPSNEVVTDEAITSPEDMQQLLNSSYDVVANTFNGNNQRFSELLADNVFIPGNSGFLVQVYNRSTDFFNSDVGGYYGQPYIAVLRANTILENLDAISLSAAERNRFEGEAKFIRAIAHFELVRHFAQPFGFTTDNSHLGIVIQTSSDVGTDTRSTVAEVYAQIEADLLEAEQLLPDDNGNYATNWSAKAYLAKMYFQMNDFETASTYAADVIENGPFTFSSDLNNRYDQTVSTETVFTIISTNIEDNRAGTFRSMFDSRANVPVLQISDDYYNELVANGGDRSAWAEDTGEARVFTKFNIDFMNVSLSNLTELMLIAAESYGELNQNLGNAIGYVNQIKQRANVSPIPGTASSDLVISESRKERRLEFGGEGYRIHELKRRGVLGEDVLVRNAPWDCDGMVLQFPASELAIKGFEMNPEGGCN